MQMTELFKAAALLLPLTTALPIVSAAGQPRAPSTTPVESRTFTGWITFHGEFALYDRRQDVGNTYYRTCYSGQMGTTRQQRDAARRYEGKRVRITGTLIPAKEYWGTDGLGKLVENFCARDQILIGRSIALLTPGSSKARGSTR